ncbi:hypothetical protein [Acinetobacter calcoaceticus]
MTVKTTGFTIKDAFEAKTKRFRSHVANLVTPAREAAEALENTYKADKVAEVLAECASMPSSHVEELLRLQQGYSDAKTAASIYAELLKNVKVSEGRITSLPNSVDADSIASVYAEILKNVTVMEGCVTKPRTRLGAEALRDAEIDLDTVNYAFDRAMKQSHG